MSHTSYNMSLAEPRESSEIPVLFWVLLAATVLASVSVVLNSIDLLSRGLPFFTT